MTSIPTFSRPGRARTAATAATASGGRERFLLPVAIVAVALVGLAAWMLLVSPLRGDANATAAQATTATQQADDLQSRVATLKAQQGDLPRYRAELAAAQAALPTTAAMPAFLRSLQDLGTSTGTSVTALTASEPQVGSADDTVTVPGVGQVYKVPVTVTVAGGYDGLTAFVAGLQTQQPRAVLVDTVSESTTDAGATTLTVTMTAFVAPTAGSGNGG